MELFQHQKEFLDKNPDRTALVWSCGTGKTRTAIEWAAIDEFPALVVCPKALKENWKREIRKYDPNAREGFWTVMTKEEFKKWVMQNPLNDHICQIIVDEVHNGFLTPNFKSQMSKCLRDFIKKNKIERVLLLSATVYTSSPWNIFTLATLLGHSWNWREFQWKYFYAINMGGRMIMQAKKGVEKDMAVLTKGIASVVDIHDCMDVPEQLHLDPEYVALTKEQTVVLKNNYDPVHIVRYTRQHEIENGVLLPDKNGLIAAQIFECDKVPRIISLVEENKKIAIVCRYNMQIDMLRDRLKKEFPHREIYIIRGDTKDRDTITLECEAREDAIVLIQADCAEGYQLPSFGICVFASQSYSYAKYEQICGRFLRMDKPSRTTFVYLIAGEDSVDQAVYDSIKKKEDFQIQLYGIH